MSLLGYITGSNKRNLIKNLIDEGSEIIDIRDSKDYLKGHVPGARNIPQHLILSRADDLKNNNTPVILYGAKKDDAKEITEQLKDKGVAAVNGGNLQKMQAMAIG